MIESTVIQYLSQLEVPVYAEMPEQFEAPLIIVERTSGGRVAPGVYTAVLAIQCYADRLLETAELAYKVRDHMEGFGHDDRICSCTLNAGPYVYNHPARREYRYQLVYDVTHYGEG